MNKPKENPETINNGVNYTVQEIKEEQYHKLNIAFSLMTVIPFLVFLYIIVTRLFSIDIVIGDIGLALAIALILSFLGYWIGYSIVQSLINKVISYIEKLKDSYKKLKSTQEMLVQAEKYKAIGQLASGVAHEIKNPIGILMQDINYLEDNKPAGKDLDTILSMMKKNIKRADSIISALGDFSRASKIDAVPIDINEIIENSLLLIKPRAELGSITISKDLKQDLPKILADNIRVEQAIVNILLNAVQAMPGYGNLSIKTSLQKIDDLGISEESKKSGKYISPGEEVIVVEVEDTGLGIAKENLKLIFNPFFTTKNISGGTGLGLSVTKNIIDMHKGIIDIDSAEGKGTKVTIVLKLNR